MADTARSCCAPRGRRTARDASPSATARRTHTPICASRCRANWATLQRLLARERVRADRIAPSGRPSPVGARGDRAPSACHTTCMCTTMPGCAAASRLVGAAAALLRRAGRRAMRGVRRRCGQPDRRGHLGCGAAPAVREADGRRAAGDRAIRRRRRSHPSAFPGRASDGAAA